MNRRFIIIGILLILTSRFVSFAQNEEPFKVQRLTTPIKFDGIPNEKGWSDIIQLPHGVYLPTYGDQPTEKSEFFLTYDDKYIYLAGNLFAPASRISDTGKS